MTTKLGIRREDKNEFERRVPLVPDQVRKLVRQGIDVYVQPSDIRVFKNEEYEAAGARVQEDLSECGMVLGVKEMPIPFFRPGGGYMFFAHVIKGQDYNMPMLKKMMELGCTLLDYEKVVDENNRRLIFFGEYAGLAGMLEILYFMGKRLEADGHRTPLTALKRPLDYADLGEAKAALEVVGKWIEQDGFPEFISPVVIGFAGYGNVSQGAQAIFDMLPHEAVAPEDLQDFVENGDWSAHKLYKVVYYEKDMVVPKTGDFELQNYYQHPENYDGTFAQYLPNLTALVNCIYWDERYPRLVTKEWLKENWGEGKRAKLIVLGDISCDIGGSIECTVKATDPGNPAYVYEPGKDDIVEGFRGNGPVVMAVDTLPCELPRDSSAKFGTMLMPFMPAIAGVDLSVDFEGLQLPAPIKKSAVLHHGKLTPDYEYIERYL